MGAARLDTKRMYRKDQENMIRINIKPLSVNALYRGRRYKTKAYEEYERAVFFSLPKMKVPDGPIYLQIEAGMSNRRADLSNVIKGFEDLLGKKYGFNDNRVFKILMEKRIVGKGEEYVAFKIESAVMCTCTHGRLKKPGFPGMGIKHGKGCGYDE